MSGTDAVRSFCDEVTAAGEVWTVRTDAGVYAPLAGDGVPRVPFWSARRRLEPLLRREGPLPPGCRAERLDLRPWREMWLPRLDSNVLLIGLNWTGRGLRGVDVSAAQVLRALRLPELGEQDRAERH